LKGIATLPEYRGRGVASALLLRGILDARSRCFKTFWLESTPDAVGLYRRFGFCDVEVLKMDVTVDGKEQTIEFIAMKRTN
jgi:ribosomal protein S18 acetylase RimI-like enzyme